jgi:hypothetical protein
MNGHGLKIAIIKTCIVFKNVLFGIRGGVVDRCNIMASEQVAKTRPTSLFFKLDVSAEMIKLVLRSYCSSISSLPHGRGRDKP